LVVKAILERLQLLWDLDTNKDFSPMELVNQGVVDPCKVFVKNEPHKDTKIQEGRVRLICSVSLIDNIIARLLCELQNKTEIAHHTRLSVKPGLGLHDDGLRSLNNYVSRKFADVVPAEGDAKGWDWSVQSWDFDMDCERRVDLARGRGTDYERILRAHFYCMARKVFILGDGTMHQQMLPGIMPSGWFNTSSSNSNIRVMNHHILARRLGFTPKIMAMGDDSVEANFEDAVIHYASLGKTMGMFNAVETTNFEFCSTSFDGDLGFPVNIDKQIFNLLSNTSVTQVEAKALWDAFQREMRNLPHSIQMEVFEVVHKSGWTEHFKVAAKQACWPIGSPYVIAQNSFCANQNAKRLHGASNEGCRVMYSPGLSLRYPIQMTRKGSKKTVVVMAPPKQKPKRKQKKQTPFGDVGSKLGGAVGSFFGRSGLGSGIGRWLGSGIGSIFGSGDYQVVGDKPGYNVLAGSIPQFSSSRATNIVCHREYIGDITGTTAFNNNLYPLNPGIDTTFPWLQGVASNYQQYRIHGLMFEFRPLITDFVTGGSPGVVIMSTSYNADLPKYTSKQAMENAEFATSTKPTLALRHMVECDPGQTPTSMGYIRGGPVPTGQDLRSYDLGTFQLATQNNPVQNLGELWVTYCIEFYKPTLDISNLVTDSLGAHIVRTSVSATNPVGLIGAFQSGSLTATCTGTTITLSNASVGVTYNMNWMFSCTTAATNNLIIPTVMGGNALGWNSQLGTADSASGFSTTGTASTFSSANLFFVATAQVVVLTFPGGGTFGAGPNGSEFVITVIDPRVQG
jgi:hypothetical protein